MKSTRPNFPELDEGATLTCRPLDERVARSREHEGLALNIFGGGIAFRQPDRVEPGQLLALELDVPGIPVTVLALGRCEWCEAAEACFEVGARLHWVGWSSPAVQDQIAAFIRDSLAKGGSLRLLRPEEEG